jgi:hypothetical protein
MLRSSLTIALVLIICLDVFDAIPSDFYEHGQLDSLIEKIKSDTDSDQWPSLNNNDSAEEDDQQFKRNKYTNFHLSPLWLSRRTRTNRIYGKPLWISRTG